MKKLNSSSIISIIFLLVILVMINVIGVRNFFRLDLTSSKMYSLSQASKDIVSNINDKVLIKAFFTPDLPSPFNTTARYLRDLLEDYRAYSKGHLDYVFIDPGSEEALEREAQTFRIPPRQVQKLTDDKFEATKAYMGVAFIYGDKQEVIPVLSNITSLEYEITSLINRLTSPKLPKLGIASSGTEEDKVSMQQLYESLGRNYDIQPLNLEEPVGSDFDGVFLMAPRQPLTDWQLFNLDQYIINGGKAAIFANSYQGIMEQGVCNFLDLNLGDFLKNYGIAIGEDVLIDARSASVSVPERQGFFNIPRQVQLPYLPNINNFNKENIITRDLAQLQTYFPSSVDTTLAESKGYEIEGLMYTSENSGRDRGYSIRMDPYRYQNLSDYQEKSIPVAAIVKGNFTSYFAEMGPPGKPVPSEENEDSGEQETEEYDGPFTASTEMENRLLVVGDGNIALDTYVQNNPWGIMFMLNVADWLVQAESLISIRSKHIVLKPLKDVPNIAKKVIKWSNHIGPVVLVIIFGIVLWQVRRFRKKILIIQ